MKLLQEEFKSNVDQTGLQTFKQIKISDAAAIYQRIRSDGTTHSFEAFKIKVVKAGAKLPGGLTVQEDYVSYPGKNSFGKTAYSCKSLSAAEARYDELIKKASDAEAEADEVLVDEVIGGEKVKSEKSSTGGKRGRKAIDRSSIKVPKDKFTIKQLELLNPTLSFALLYQHIRGLLGIEYKISGTITGGRGKPKIIYSPIDMAQ